MMTFTSRGGSTPIGIASMRMNGSVRFLGPAIDARLAGTPDRAPQGRRTPDRDNWGGFALDRAPNQWDLGSKRARRQTGDAVRTAGSVGPGESDLVERFRSESLGGAGHH